MSGLPEEPGIMIDDPMMIWCNDHLEPFRKRWPRGYVPASMCLVNQALEDDEVMAAAGNKVESLNAVLREFGPLCCRYSSIMRELNEFPTATKKRWRILMQKYSFAPPAGWKEDEVGPA